ncbi:MAG: Alpha N-terminal protein methyltransferase 1 [Cirrosporium novae-zelandiae]|nr:MAG: Alpha N-terminal protein methyltransferase 1 [Cirrosporium novae-zelandiae]
MSSSSSNHPPPLPLPPPDSQISPTASLTYWNSIPPNISGMLGGYPYISRVDLQGSKNFLAKLRRWPTSTSATNGGKGKGKKLKRVVDCGAGIGRVTKGFLVEVGEVVDVVEPVEKFVGEVRRWGKAGGEGEKVGDIYVVGLEDWKPIKTYDLIWNQWCLGHLTDSQLLQYLKRCRDAVSQEEDGWIVVKENMSTNTDGSDIFDELDSSVTRADSKFRSIFQQAGLEIVRTELQKGFPRELYPVRFYALRPAS